MDQLKQLLARLSLKQRVSIIVTVLAVVGGIVALSRWNKERDFRPIYTHLPAEDAGQVLARLRESAVEFRLADNGGTILVPSQKVAELRLQMASSGLPKSGRMGFELFDKTNFGATDFAEQVNYHRAIEGELERSVLSINEVEQARVHITFPKDSIYTESRQAAKASVMVKLKSGARLSPQNVSAVQHLTASAVEGLQPEGVAVLDMSGTLLSGAKKTETAELNDATLEYRQKVEHDLGAKIQATLEPLLGAEHYRAAVSVDCDITSGEQSEEVFDPTKSVMLTSQRTEDGSTVNTASGTPGTPSNLPRPTSRPGSASSGLNRRTENIAFQSSRMVRHTKIPQGTLKRISVSVLVDHETRVEKGKKVLIPPTPEKLKVVHDLVAGAIGSVNERDQIMVESFPFDATLRWEPPAPPAPPSASGPAPNGSSPQTGLPAWLQQLMKQKNFPIIAGAAGGVLLLIVGGVVFWLFKRKKSKAKVQLEAARALEPGRESVAGHVAGGDGQPDITKNLEAQIAQQAALQVSQAEELLASIRLPQAKTKKSEVLVKHIIGEAKKDPAAMAQVIRSWLNSEG